MCSPTKRASSSDVRGSPSCLLRLWSRKILRTKETQLCSTRAAATGDQPKAAFILQTETAQYFKLGINITPCTLCRSSNRCTPKCHKFYQMMVYLNGLRWYAGIRSLLQVCGQILIHMLKHQCELGFSVSPRDRANVEQPIPREQGYNKSLTVTAVKTTTVLKKEGKCSTSDYLIKKKTFFLYPYFLAGFLRVLIHHFHHESQIIVKPHI